MRGVDATVLTLLLNDKADSPPDPTTGKPVEKIHQRVNFLVSELQRQKQKIIIPTPVLSEVLVVSGRPGLRYIDVLQKAAVFEIRDFDRLAAIELALMTEKAIGNGDKRSGSIEPWQKVKLDRQIVAICKVSGATTLYASDHSLSYFARQAGLTVIEAYELPLPPQDVQMTMHDILEAKEPDQEAPSSSESEEDENQEA